MTLHSLIRSAYRVQDAQIVGGPDWIDADRFTIEAEGDAGDSPAVFAAHGGGASRLELMLQPLQPGWAARSRIESFGRVTQVLSCRSRNSVRTELKYWLEVALFP